MSKVAVIGAGGHVGLPFSLVVADAGHQVFGIDVNEEVVDGLNEGHVPYIEEGAEKLLRSLSRERLLFSTNPAFMSYCDVIAVMLGTPVDEENNPRLDALFDFVDNTLLQSLAPGQLIILRSTVSPGTTEVIKDRIFSAMDWVEGEDYHLVYCPERVMQGHGIEETAKLPQLVGAFMDSSFEKARDFFKTFVHGDILRLIPREAEIGKLMTNMYRYVNFALANEFYMIADKQGVNIDKVIDAVNHDYPRMNMPHPGPNVGGPCLFKDGRFLLSDVPFADLIQVSFLINEGMPDYIFNRVKEINPQIHNVLILGTSFKAGSDDIRNSLSFKMKKVCKKHGADVHMYDPITGPHVWSNLPMDVVIVMTPHKELKKWILLRSFPKNTIIVDIWKLFDESKQFNNGIYKVGDIHGESISMWQ